MQVSIQQHLRNRVAHYSDLVRARYPKIGFQTPRVEFFTNRKASGTANWMENLVKFNTILAAENIDIFDNTVIHEMAHLVAPRVFGPFIKPHGREFKFIMSVLGGTPNRCHSYDTSNVQSRTRTVTRGYKYTCGCPEKVFNLTIIRHKRIQSGKSYRCCNCNVQLKAA